MKRDLYLSLGLALLTLLAFSSCQEDCDPVDVDAINSLYLEFNTDGGANSFSAEELDSAYFVRYEPFEVDSFLFPTDTFNLYEIGFYEANSFKIRLGREAPLGVPTGAPYYTHFMYKFMSRGQDWQVRLQEIKIEGSYLDDCTYDPQLKQFMLNDDTLVVTGSTDFVQMFKD